MITIAPKLAAVIFAYQKNPLTQPIVIQVASDRYERIVLLAQTIVLFCQTILLVLIAIWTYVGGSRQKIRERRAAWYQKAVVDHILPLVSGLFRKQTGFLSSASQRCIELRDDVDARPLEDLVKETIAKFKDDLYSVQEEVSDRAAVFDPKLRDAVNTSLDGLEESISEWFDVHAFSRSRQNARRLTDILSESHTRLIKILYDFEFTQFR